jgi:tol-pal system protein YbgF
MTTIKTTMSFAACCLVGALAGLPALAQDDTSTSWARADRLARLEAAVAAVDASLPRTGGPYTGEPDAPVQVAQVDAADFEVRVQRLERSIQELTGRVEENAHLVHQLRDRLERSSSDIEYRLNHLESAPAGKPEPAGGGKVAAAPAAPPAAPSGPTPPRTPEKPADAKGAAAPPPSADPVKQYEYAFDLLRQADYDRAEKAFTDFLARNKGHAYSANAQYWLGETFYVRAKFSEAAVAFAEAFQKYPKGSKAADSLLKLGMSMAQLNQKGDACTAFGQLTNKFPDAPASIKRRADSERRRLNCPGA